MDRDTVRSNKIVGVARSLYEIDDQYALFK